MAENIDFAKIRGDEIEGQRAAFEQLVCSLARLDNRFPGEFRRIEGSGGDGGVEAIRVLSTGKEIGFQAKYHLNRDAIDWAKIDNSVEQALKHHPALERYVISFPCDFTGKRGARGGSTEGLWGKWDIQVKHWTNLAAASGMRVEFEPWTAFELEARLRDSDAQHLLRYFFDRLVFSRAWMRRHLDRTIHDLRARYSPREHVDTTSLQVFDVLFRRQNVLQDLQSVFDLAHRSDPRAARALIDESLISDTELVSIESSLAGLSALGAALEWPVQNPWPVEAWFVSWYAATRKLGSFHNVVRDLAGRERGLPVSAEQIGARTKYHDLLGPEVFGGHWAHLLPADSSRAVLFVGRAGAGKSHVLARAIDTAWSDGVPAIHVLGQHITDEDPRASILKRLELGGWSFHDLLSALNLAAEAAKTRALLTIDALNEGRGLFVWRHHLAAFIAEVNKHDRIVLVISCREEYLPYVVPADVIADPNVYPEADGSPPTDAAPIGKVIRVPVRGFSTAEEREDALRRFMDEKGIARPTAPVLDDEFFNPLFMSSVCRAMAGANITVFPRGLRGARDIFDFALRTKCRALGTPYDGTDRPFVPLRAALGSIAQRMIEQQSDSVPVAEAQTILKQAFQSLPLSDQTWLDVIEGSDILRRDVMTTDAPIGWAMPNEVIRFAFQRLQDNLVAEYLVGRTINIESAFSAGASMEFLIERTDNRKSKQPVIQLRPQWIGTIGALWSAVAEKYGKELCDLESFFGNQSTLLDEDEFREVFRVSVRERSKNAFSVRTKEILDHLWREDQPEKLEILLSTACVPDHAWNADFLHHRMRSFSMSDRDLAWSRHFGETYSRLPERVSEIIDWAVNPDTQMADEEVTYLAAVTLTWLLAVANRSIRDRATKALVNIFVHVPKSFSDTLLRFRGVDDLYVLDQLLAAGYGSICLDPTDDRMRRSALTVADVMFPDAGPPVHLAVRDWARSILERAHERGVGPANFDMTRAAAPYGSAPPVFDLTEAALAEIARNAEDNAIARSCGSAGDFYNYVIKSAVGEFSDVPVTDPPPWTREERAERFEARVRTLAGDASKKLTDLLKRLEAARADRTPHITRSDDPLTISLETSDPSPEVVEALARAEQAFLIALPDAWRAEYDTELAPTIHGHYEAPSIRNPEPMGLWIAHRAYELGWRKARFPTEPYSDSRQRQQIERIGKKYQWLALEELTARLADNFWMVAGAGRSTRRFQGRTDVWRRGQIDPTILALRRTAPAKKSRLTGPPVLAIESASDAELKDWPFRDDHFNNPEPWLRVEIGGRRHLVATWFESLDEKPEGEAAREPYRRQVQAFVSLAAHPIGERQKFLSGFFENASRGIDQWDLQVQPDGFLAHEIGLLGADAISFWKHPNHDGLRIATPIVTGGIDHETDQSIETSVRFLVPHPRIRTALGLRILDPRNTGLWVCSDDTPFLVNHDVVDSVLTIDEEQFRAWCRSEGLEYTWIYIGERTAWIGVDDATFRRTVGAAWYDEGVLCGAVQRPHG